MKKVLYIYKVETVVKARPQFIKGTSLKVALDLAKKIFGQVSDIRNMGVAA